VFVIPHPEGVLVGTTDIYHEGWLDDPRPTRNEVDYLLRALRAQFPSRNVSQRDVVGAFAGLRPILDTHAENPSEASREEAIWEEMGMVSVAGGKLTTWRVTAAEAVEEALKFLPDERADRAGPSLTEGTALVGFAPPHLPAALREQEDMLDSVADGMARRLRDYAWWALKLARDRRELDPLLPGTDLSAAEVRTHLRFGAVLHLEDLLLRRARVGLWEPERARELVPFLRLLFAQELGWDNARWASEEAGFAQALEAWSPEGVR
jgi:glycerol-3-phosphate dehydrogenase